MAYSSLAIANEFIRRAQAGGRTLTHMQLQKLTYIAHGWTLAIYDRPLIEDAIEAWEFGPVIRKLYDALQYRGRNFITEPIHWGQDTGFTFDDGEVAEEPLTQDEQDVIDRVWENYGGFSGYQLSALTHKPGTPWTEVYEHGKNHPISNDRIKAHFEQLAANP